jgi:lipoprotein-anchoring transpeptidase ErfK/SrfK
MGMKKLLAICAFGMLGCVFGQSAFAAPAVATTSVSAAATTAPVPLRPVPDSRQSPPGVSSTPTQPAPASPGLANGTPPISGNTPPAAAQASVTQPSAAALVQPSSPAVPAAAISTPAAPKPVSPPAVPAISAGVVTQPVYDHVDHAQIPDGEQLFDEARDGSAIDPLNWSVYIFKTRHLLEVYYKGHLFKDYHAVFGRSRWAGGKEWEGDGRTPEGNYLIVAKHRSARFRWFLRINYPNAIDVARYEQLRSDHEIPLRLGVGGEVGIHGTDNPLLNVGDVNWTTGCISVDNADISVLAGLLPIGTLVVIKP